MHAKLRGALSRRTFLKIGGAAVAGSTLSLTGTSCQKQDESRIKEYRTLGRTGFKVSDISFGGDPATTEVVQYAYDKGINLQKNMGLLVMKNSGSYALNGFSAIEICILYV